MTTGIGPTKPLMLGPLTRSSAVFSSAHDPAAAATAAIDASALALATRLALSTPSSSDQLALRSRPAVKRTSCSIDTPALPVQEMLAFARVPRVVTGLATRFIVPSGTAC